MAQVTQPLFSGSATGRFGNDIVFVRGRNGPVVRTRVIPFNPQSTLQTGNRAALAGVSLAWTLLSPADAATWDALAAAQSLANRNVMAARNLARFRDGQAGFYSTEAIGAVGAPEVPANGNYTSNDTIDTLAWSHAAVTAGNWIDAIMRVPTGDPAPTVIRPSNLIKIVAAEANQSYQLDFDDQGTDYDYYVQAIGRDQQVSAVVEITVAV